MKYLQRLLINLFRLFVTLLVLGTGLICYGYFYVKYKLPNVDVLNDIHLQVPMKVYTLDGKLIDEYGEKRRIPVSLQEVPPLLIKAVLATEDSRYYEHAGVDPVGLLRAIKQLMLTGKKEQGASTITMQVARNFFLNRKKTYSRKINEILLAFMIEQKLSKDKILELYLNKIYLGNRAYGVAAAAQVYFGKKLNELTLPEMAMIAGLAQAPSHNNPIVNPKRALSRRDHVLQRMLELGYIDKKAAEAAIKSPISASYHGTKPQIDAPYIGEMVRDALFQQYGEAAYTEGFNVYTTIPSDLEEYATTALRKNLLAYDQRHGYRGPEQQFGPPPANASQVWLPLMKKIPVYGDLYPAAILKIQNNSATALLRTGEIITIPAKGLSWARRSRGSAVKPGALVRVIRTDDQTWKIVQVPKAESALVSMNPQSGAILAIVGGYSYKKSKFNRAIQARLQPGSNFKPFIYSAALDQGFTLSSIVNDSPIVIRVPGTHQIWRPQNADHKFNGPTRLRVGLIRSRNMISIRLLEALGLPNVIDYATRFGFDPKNLPHNLTLALGTASVSPLEMVTAYSVFANGGYRVTPYFIDHITDNQDRVIFKADPKLACLTCNDVEALNLIRPPADKIAPQVISAQNAYLMTSVLLDVIRKGTGAAAMKLGRKDLGGKTGTTNDKFDAWFSGFNADIATTVWVGFDQPDSLHEYGGQAALPGWMLYMEKALAGKPEHTLPEPPGMVYVRIDPRTGLRAPSGSKGGIFEVFNSQYEPDYDIGGYDYYGYGFDSSAESYPANDSRYDALYNSNDYNSQQLF